MKKLYFSLSLILLATHTSFMTAGYRPKQAKSNKKRNNSNNNGHMMTYDMMQTGSPRGDYMMTTEEQYEYDMMQTGSPRGDYMMTTEEEYEYNMQNEDPAKMYSDAKKPCKSKAAPCPRNKKPIRT